jgi:hypothetical protein
MPKSRKALVLAILAVVLAVGVAAAIWYVSPAREHGGSLTGAEITTLVSGNTIKGPKFSEYYAPDGSIRGREIEDKVEEYLGTWRVDGDQLCIAFPSHDYASCVSINPRQGGGYDFADAAHHATRTIVAGNPNNL